MTTVAELNASLAEVKAAISAIHKNGQSVNISGAYSSSSASLNDLRAEKKEIEHQLLLWQGYLPETESYIE